MTLSIQSRHALADARGAAARPRPTNDRLSVGTDGHFYFRGSPIILRGMNFGSELFYKPGDAALVKAMGGNHVRIVARAWSPPLGVGGEGDGYDPASPIGGFINVAYFNTISAAIHEAKSLHTPSDPFFVFLALDSNCGQRERTDPVSGANCWINGAPATFFTPTGAQRLKNHKNSARAYLRTHLGLLDGMEPFVEPNPDVTWPRGGGVAYSDLDVMDLQEGIIQYVHPEDPGMVWIIGGLTYFPNRLGFPSLMARRDWLDRGNVAFTCDILDNKVVGPEADLDAFVAGMTDFRSHYHRAIYVNQVGARSTDDPTYAFEDRVYAKFASPANGGGSISWSKWSFVGDTGQHYEPYHQDATTGARTSDAARITSITNGCNLPRLYS